MKKNINWFLHPPVTGQSTILTLRQMAGNCIFIEKNNRPQLQKSCASIINKASNYFINFTII